MKKILKKTIAITLAALMMALTITACGEKKSDTIVVGITDRNLLEEDAISFGIKNNGKMQDDNFPENLEKKFFPSLNAALLELKSDKMDFMMGIPLCTAEYITKTDSSLSFVPGTIGFDFAMGTSPDKMDLRDEMNDAIAELKENGELDKLIQEYITNPSGAPVPNEIIGNPEGDTHIVGITGDFPPMDYVSEDGTPAGFNVALLNAISQLKGCNFKIVQVQADARLAALEGNKIDIVFLNIIIKTDGFKYSGDAISITEPYFSTSDSFVTKDFPTEQIKEMYTLE